MKSQAKEKKIYLFVEPISNGIALTPILMHPMGERMNEMPSSARLIPLKRGDRGTPPFKTRMERASFFVRAGNSFFSPECLSILPDSLGKHTILQTKEEKTQRRFRMPTARKVPVSPAPTKSGHYPAACSIFLILSLNIA